MVDYTLGGARREAATTIITLFDPTGDAGGFNFFTRSLHSRIQIIGPMSCVGRPTCRLNPAEVAVVDGPWSVRHVLVTSCGLFTESIGLLRATKILQVGGK